MVSEYSRIYNADTSRPEAQRQGGSSSLWSLYQDLQLAPADLRHRGREGAALYGLYTRIYNSHQPT